MVKCWCNIKYISELGKIKPCTYLSAPSVKLNILKTYLERSNERENQNCALCCRTLFPAQSTATEQVNKHVSSEQLQLRGSIVFG